ncbi:CPBP family intramembrane metalloprotease [Bacillus canaveralius]|uniref:CPBP family intramembrane metalloprotease n=1 Tax=Bacillus canaveralius TaxID=1403243 RepID=A0A2N5GJN6_9BACI|nr:MULTISPECIES: CPBP family intramembrane glutamic endopeptidase [Bacillus]PLR81420.1 CPBP family intramembrane metalloprotease [Bacillus canaveralius]PLR85751.1 CPBP family intramembrane metalloprotease [Bacillus sp. V33-4]PLR90041.1 CPBP family intramembrane metalloprotease [Bacillus canaveralius]RSK53080.1 CPBP family intramembrane metalloprotease [Bacillus canaveralius]
MKKWIFDSRLIIGFLLAHLLMFFTFENRAVFWYMFTAAMLILISYSILNEEVDDQQSVGSYLLYGLLSGFVLFAVFWAGNFLIDLLNLPFSKGVAKLYNRLAPAQLWHYIVLILVIIPGEEIFWRGFIQKRLEKYVPATASIVLAAVMYTSVHFYAGYMVLPIAALFGGLFWGFLYWWKRSIPLVIVSHLVFDLFLFVFIPLY